jgi:hypothetical protein
MPLVILQQTNKKNWLIEETRSKTFMTRSNSATFSWLASFVSLRICEEYYITCDESNKANRIIIVSFWKKKEMKWKVYGVEVLFLESKNTGKSYLFDMIPEPFFRVVPSICIE